MNLLIFKQLQEEGFLSEESFEKIKNHEHDQVISVRLELKTLMYVGVLLLTTGTGIIIYKNLDTIGHLAIVLFTALATIGCFAFCIKKAAPFTREKSTSNNLVYDYILLLGCLLLLILVAYVQYQYELFGDRYGLATFTPMVILFASAYYFDHLGVLSLAITNLAAWVGIVVTPLQILKRNDFSSSTIIYTGFALGILLVAAAYTSVAKNVKAHFSFTYKNFGTHILFISAIAALINFKSFHLLWFIPLALLAAGEFKEAIKERSFYFFVITSLYFYFGLSYLVVRALLQLPGDGSIYAALFYFILSGLALAFFLMHYNKQFKKDDSL